MTNLLNPSNLHLHSALQFINMIFHTSVLTLALLSGWRGFHLQFVYVKKGKKGLPEAKRRRGQGCFPEVRAFPALWVLLTWQILCLFWVENTSWIENKRLRRPVLQTVSFCSSSRKVDDSENEAFVSRSVFLYPTLWHSKLGTTHSTCFSFQKCQTGKL